MSAEYAGVSVDHPRIVAAVEKLKKNGHGTDSICKIVGMPHEVVRKIERRVENAKTNG